MFLGNLAVITTIIHEVAIAGYKNENYLPLRALDFYSNALFMLYLIINMSKIPFTPLTFWAWHC